MADRVAGMADRDSDHMAAADNSVADMGSVHRDFADTDFVHKYSADKDFAGKGSARMVLAVPVVVDIVSADFGFR